MPGSQPPSQPIAQTVHRLSTDSSHSQHAAGNISAIAIAIAAASISTAITPTAAACPPADVTFINAKVEGVQHGEGCSTILLDGGRKLQGSLVLDATGHARRLVKFDKKFDPGYQGAYGIIAGEASVTAALAAALLAGGGGWRCACSLCPWLHLLHAAVALVPWRLQQCNGTASHP